MAGLGGFLTTTAYEARERRRLRRQDEIDRAAARVRETRDYLIGSLCRARDTDHLERLPITAQGDLNRYRHAVVEMYDLVTRELMHTPAMQGFGDADAPLTAPSDY